MKEVHEELKSCAAEETDDNWPVFGWKEGINKGWNNPHSVKETKLDSCQPDRIVDILLDTTSWFVYSPIIEFSRQIYQKCVT